MLNINQITLGAVVSFELWPSMILGTGLEHTKIEGLLNFDDANKYIDVAAQHAQVYPTLPPGSPNNPKSYYYLKCRLLSGDVTVIGIPWVKESTWVVKSNVAIRFTIPDITHDDEQIIRAQLGAIGYKLVDVEYL